MKRQIMFFPALAAAILLLAGFFALRSYSQVVFEQQPSAADAAMILSPPALQIANMSAAGASDGDLTSFISNFPSTFSLTAQGIVCLQEMGVSSAVTLAMLNHDFILNNNPGAVPPISLDAPATEPQIMPSSIFPDAASPPLFDDTSPQMDDSFSTLAPYGSWDFLAGSGWCWQPSGWLGYMAYPWGLTQLNNGCWWRHPNRGWLWFPNSNFHGTRNGVIASSQINSAQTNAPHMGMGQRPAATHHRRR